MKVGIIGKGMIVKDLLTFIDTVNGIEIRAICSTPGSYKELQQFGETHHIPCAYSDADELLEDADIDTVYVAVPNHLHYEMAEKALNAGKNVILEKPFTSNYREAERLVELAEKKDLIILEALSTRYLPNVRAIKENLKSLGQLKIVSMNYSQYSSRYDAFKQGIVQPAFDPHKSGGALMDLNIYNLNLAVYLFGEPDSIDYLANIEKNIDTSGILILQYSSFQCICIAAKDCKAPILSTIQGDQGCILIPSPANSVAGYEIIMNDQMGSSAAQILKPENIQDYNAGKHRMYYEFKEFERIIREGDKKAAREAAKATLAVMKLQTAAREAAGIVFDADLKGAA